ncbi:MAG TPA: 8-amino-7-oxononanoate synthase [Cellvibrionaceae bacterium]|nr:8-amino-7-oxononanoate synthase [Cellvibrionaceae bacterium]
MTDSLTSFLASKLAERKEAHLYRRRLCLDSPQGPEVSEGGRRLVNFCSNDYLSPAAHPKLQEAFSQAASQYGFGSGASHLVCGHSAPHQQLEEALAAFTGRARALVFSSGYSANLGVITSFLGRADAIFEDRLNHASLIDGGLLSGAAFERFKHNDVGDLTARLAKSTARYKLVAVDGVFSMDGDRAPLVELAELSRAHNAWLMVDDAHGFGVLGPNGGGSTESAGLTAQDVPIYMGTLGKALGCAGAFIAGSEDLIECLIQLARSYIYTTALPPALAAATCAALALVQQEPERRQRLRGHIAHFTAGAKARNLSLAPSQTAIQPLILGDNARALAWQQALAARGFWVGAIRPPTVPVGSARLRITLTAGHSRSQIESLLDALAELAHSEAPWI